MTIERIAGIGPYSGCEGDPGAAICDPGGLTPSQRDVLREVEDSSDPDVLMASRYVLVAARK